jgi:hypothetical protein
MRLNKVIAATPLTSCLSAFRPSPSSNPSARASPSETQSKTSYCGIYESDQQTIVVASAWKRAK